MLLESPSIQDTLTVERVRGCFHQPGAVTDAECEAVIDIVKLLRDYVPTRRFKTTGGTTAPTPHIATGIGTVLIANQFLRIEGYPAFT